MADRIWQYNCPQLIVVEVSEAEIMEIYYPSWCDRMRAKGCEHHISKENCIADWVYIHWAWEKKT